MQHLVTDRGAVNSGCDKTSGAMQARGMRAVYSPLTASGMLKSSGQILLISEAAVSFDGMGRSSRSHQSSLMVMVGGVSPATMSQEKALSLRSPS